MSKSFEITVPGTEFKIKSDTIYTVLPKPDPNAPDGYREHGTTKVIHPDVGVTHGAPYDSDMEVWNTGFYEYSPCLIGLSTEAKKAHIQLATKFLIEPVEAIKGKGVLDHKKENKFFDEFAITLANKTVFNTSNPIERLSLYLSILAKELSPKENIGNPIFKQAAYMVVNRDTEISNVEQIGIDNAKATGEFYTLLKNDKAKLTKIFKYLRIADTSIEDEPTFISIFNRFLKDKQDGYRNSKIFLSQLEKFDTESGEEELHLYSMISELYEARKVELIKSDYYIKGQLLGPSIKHAAMAAMASPELKKLIVEVSATEDEDMV